MRVIEVPKMTDGELADNMRVDADRYIPFPPSEVIMDFKALRDLPSDPDAANMEVFAGGGSAAKSSIYTSPSSKKPGSRRAPSTWNRSRWRAR